MVNPINDFVELEFTVDKEDLIAGVLEVVSQIKPYWTSDKIKHTVFKDGITNKLVGVYSVEDESNKILVRIYGENTERIIDRTSEIKNIQMLQSRGFAPKLYASFSNGLAYQYLPGIILDVQSCRDDKIYHLVGQHMARFHLELRNLNCNFVSNGSHMESFLWEKMKCFFSLLPKKYDDVVKQERFIKNIPSKMDLVKEFDWLRTHLEKLNSPLAFCHNDLLLANILFDSENHSIHFIDFEYAAINYIAYDIANHFCEFAGVEDVDHSLYPDENFRRKWITVYLEAFHRSSKVNELELEQMLDHVEKFSVASHFFWGIWALIQAANSSIPFDFMGYSISRLGEYSRKKYILI